MLLLRGRATMFTSAVKVAAVAVAVAFGMAGTAYASLADPGDALVPASTRISVSWWDVRLTATIDDQPVVDDCAPRTIYETSHGLTPAAGIRFRLNTPPGINGIVTCPDNPNLGDAGYRTSTQFGHWTFGVIDVAKDEGAAEPNSGDGAWVSMPAAGFWFGLFGNIGDCRITLSPSARLRFHGPFDDNGNAVVNNTNIPVATNSGCTVTGSVAVSITLRFNPAFHDS